LLASEGRGHRFESCQAAIDLVGGLIAAFDEVPDELAQMEDDVSAAAMLNTATDPLGSMANCPGASRKIDGPKL
jgi:hypothetical protein